MKRIITSCTNSQDYSIDDSNNLLIENKFYVLEISNQSNIIDKFQCKQSTNNSDYVLTNIISQPSDSCIELPSGMRISISL